MWDIQHYKLTKRWGVMETDLYCSCLALWTNVECHLLSLQIKFTLNFDYNLQQVQEKAEVNFEAKR